MIINLLKAKRLVANGKEDHFPNIVLFDELSAIINRTAYVSTQDASGCSRGGFDFPPAKTNERHI